MDDGNYYAGAFFAQQSAERALKGFLYSKGYRALITHSVTELLEEASKIEGVSKGLAIMEKSLIDTISAQGTQTFIPKVPHTNIIQRK
ncbi:HEPN domain-containing protein [Candidatus Bathyarchaeota archaeon]|nr:HEPN domain-containing protein [Candidatus Bathyarchaeota archaeon]